MQHLNGNLMKKYEVMAIDAVQKVYIVQAESVEDAVDMVVEQNVEPVDTEIMITEIESVKEIRYEN
jgi:nitrogen regulatory protein PII